MSAISIFSVLFLILLIAVPIAASLGLTSVFTVLFSDVHVGMDYIVRTMATALDSYTLIAIPMFIFAGNLMAKGGISERLFNIFIVLVGKRTGGIPTAAILTCLFFGAISGSAPATVAAVGAMAIPTMINLGYNKGFSTAMVATAGGLGVIIPPSIPFIVYGTSAGVSVGDLFIAGILPGVLIALCLIGYSYYYCKTKGEDKERILAVYNEITDKGIFKVFINGFWALLTPVIILGGIYSGIVTPTEASVVAVIYSYIVSAFIYRTINRKNFVQITVDSVKTTVPILFIVAAATVFGKILTLIQLPQTVSNAMISLTDNPVLILLIIVLILLIIGMFMETLAAILILTPIFLPIAIQMGIDPIHFGIIMVVALAIGFVTPPVGMNLFVASSLTGLSILEIGRKSIPFIVAFLIALVLIMYIPQISLILVGN